VTQKLSQVRPISPEEQQAMIAQLADQQRRAQAAGQPAAGDASAVRPAPRLAAAAMTVEGAAAIIPGTPRDGFVESDPTTWGNPGRNDLCPCGSGLRFKHCHGKF